MNVIYDGKLTAWLSTELDKLLTEVLPPVGKFYEGQNSFEIKTKNPNLNPLKEKLIGLTREYARRESSDEYDNPAKAEGEVYHGCEDD